jgi:hypothetical protein
MIGPSGSNGGLTERPDASSNCLLLTSLQRQRTGRGNIRRTRRADSKLGFFPSRHLNPTADPTKRNVKITGHFRLTERRVAMNHLTANRQKSPAASGLKAGSKPRGTEPQQIKSESLIHRPQSFMDDFGLEHSSQPASLRAGIAMAATRVEPWASTRINAKITSVPSCLYLG